MTTLAMANFVIPGDSGFPLNAMYSKPSSKAEAGNMTQTFVTSQCPCSVEKMNFSLKYLSVLASASGAMMFSLPLWVAWCGIYIILKYYFVLRFYEGILDTVETRTWPETSGSCVWSTDR